MPDVIEAKYPLSFRKKQATELGDHIRHHNSVVLIGMKRVGISNFLRYFLYHPEVQKTFIKNGVTHYFIPVDLNDLVELDIFPFWTLVLTRLVDATERHDLPEHVKAQCRRLFRESIQLKDLFFTVDKIRKILMLLSAHNVYPTFFFIRFDRLKSAVTAELFNNLQGLKDAVKQKLSYVFTSFRPLHELAPNVFAKSALSVFAHDMYVKPATPKDMMSILNSFETRYNLTLPPITRTAHLSLSGGHVQYLQLALIKLHEENEAPKDKQTLLSILDHDEQILLQSEELYDSLTKLEQETLLSVTGGFSVSAEAKKKARYLWDTGILIESRGKNAIFSPLFEHYLAKHSPGKNGAGEFTKKEHLLFSFLKNNEGNLCEREDIIETVWPEYKELGVTDWAIDRLVARVRAKLKAQNSSYEIVTVITRGYKLVKKS